MRKQYSEAGANWNSINNKYVPRAYSSIVGHNQYCLRALATADDLSDHSVPCFASDGPNGNRARTRSGNILRIPDWVTLGYILLEEFGEKGF